MRHTFQRTIALGVLALATAGCMSFEIEGDGALTEKSLRGSETIHGSLYGFRWADMDVQKCSEQQGIFRVQYHTNAAFVLASALSLGLYVPQSVEWWCQAPPEKETPPENLLMPEDEE